MNQGTDHEDGTAGAAALAYARRGLRVFPVHGIRDGTCTCPKGAACRDPGKHPRTRHGLKDATSDRETIGAWWRRWPEANVGIAVPPGHVVIDADGDAGRGFVAEQHLPPTWAAFTGGGGLHYWYTLPEGVTARGSQNTGHEGIHLKAAGGYVVAPPSAHQAGTLYRWADGLSPAEVEIAEAPAWVLALVQERPRPAPGIGRDDVSPEGLSEIIPEFTRNETLFRHGCRLRARGADGPTIFAELLAANATRCRPEPLARAEVEKITRSCTGYTPGPVRVDNRLLNAQVSAEAKFLAGLIAMTGGNASPEELAALAGRDERTVRRWRAELVAAGLEEMATTRPRRRFALVPVPVLTIDGLTVGARVLAMVLAQLGDDGRVQVGQEGLADRAGAVARSIRRHLEELVAVGLVEVARAYYAGRLGRRLETNRYRLVMDSESLAAQGLRGTKGTPESCSTGATLFEGTSEAPARTPESCSTRTTSGQDSSLPLPSGRTICEPAVAVAPCPEGGRGGTETATEAAEADQGAPEIAASGHDEAGPASVGAIYQAARQDRQGAAPSDRAGGDACTSPAPTLAQLMSEGLALGEVMKLRAEGLSWEGIRAKLRPVREQGVA